MLEENFADVTLNLQNTGGNSTTTVQLPEFFDGSAALEIDIDASVEPVQWRIEPDLQRANTQALMSWLDQRLKWIAPLMLSGEITMTGNTERELVDSVQGQTAFDGGSGHIDISGIREPLLALANLLNEGERISKWPELWEYQRLVGEWQIDGTRHQLDLALDNLTAGIDGTFDPLTDTLDMSMRVLFEENAEIEGFDVNPALLGFAIPLNCRGTLEAPACGVDANATKDLVAKVLVSEEGAKVRAEIDRKIEEELPEEYRDAARGFLDRLGVSLQPEQQQAEQTQQSEPAKKQKKKKKKKKKDQQS